jgi:hypothetical protein
MSAIFMFYLGLRHCDCVDIWLEWFSIFAVEIADIVALWT